MVILFLKNKTDGNEKYGKKFTTRNNIRESWIEAIIDYYDLEEDVEKYMEENRKDED